MPVEEDPMILKYKLSYKVNSPLMESQKVNGALASSRQVLSNQFTRAGRMPALRLFANSSPLALASPSEALQRSNGISWQRELGGQERSKLYPQAVSCTRVSCRFHRPSFLDAIHSITPPRWLPPRWLYRSTIRRSCAPGWPGFRPGWHRSWPGRRRTCAAGLGVFRLPGAGALFTPKAAGEEIARIRVRIARTTQPPTPGTVGCPRGGSRRSGPGIRAGGWPACGSIPAGP